MAAIGTLPVLFATGNHASRPAASAVGKGGLYSCTTHSLVYQTDGSSWSTWASLSGTGLADPMTTRGDIIYRNASNVTDRLAIPAAGQVLGRSGSDLGAIYPPGYEYAYAEVTSNTSITATSEATATTVVTAGAVSFDGSTVALITVGSPFIAPPAGNVNIHICIYDGSSSMGRIAQFTSPDGTNTGRVPMQRTWRLTPSNASHTYSFRAWVDSGTGTVNAGAGGSSGTYMPAFIRITKA